MTIFINHQQLSEYSYSFRFTSSQSLRTLSVFISRGCQWCRRSGHSIWRRSRKRPGKLVLTSVARERKIFSSGTRRGPRSLPLRRRHPRPRRRTLHLLTRRGLSFHMMRVSVRRVPGEEDTVFSASLIPKMDVRDYVGHISSNWRQPVERVVLISGMGDTINQSRQHPLMSRRVTRSMKSSAGLIRMQLLFRRLLLKRCVSN